MIIQVYQSETDEYKEMESIESSNMQEKAWSRFVNRWESYDVIEVMTDDLIRVVDDSEEDYLYSIYNPRPLDESSQGGKWEIVEDYIGNLEELMKKNAYKPNN